MNIEEFVSEDNHMCNLGDDLFYKIFDPERFMIYLITSLTERSFTGSASI
jgi:hypothetical protein